jgi:hypothetical protein
MKHRIAHFVLPLALVAAGAAVAGPALAQSAEHGLQNPIQLVQQTVIIAPSAPPPPPVETIPAPPGSDAQTAYWQPGHWTWNGATWVWVQGGYVMRPQPSAVWVPGQWVGQSGGGYVWVAGHWQT